MIDKQSLGATGQGCDRAGDHPKSDVNLAAAAPVLVKPHPQERTLASLGGNVVNSPARKRQIK